MKSDIFEVRTSEDQAFCNSLHVLIPASWAQWTVLRSIFRFFDEDRDGFLSYEDTKPAETDHQNMGPYGPILSPALRKHLASNPLSPLSQRFTKTPAGVGWALACHQKGGGCGADCTPLPGRLRPGRIWSKRTEFAGWTRLRLCWLFRRLEQIQNVALIWRLGLWIEKSATPKNVFAIFRRSVASQ